MKSLKLKVKARLMSIDLKSLNDEKCAKKIILGCNENV